jgi:hypothetical protein
MLRGFSDLGQLRSHAASFGEGSGILVLERKGHALGRGAHIRGSVAEIRSAGLLLPGREAEGAALLKGETAPDLLSLSGTAADNPILTEGLGDLPRIEVGRLVGRSLAMGGVAMTALILSLGQGRRGLHLAASPEGPLFAIEFIGGPPVQS